MSRPQTEAPLPPELWRGHEHLADALSFIGNALVTEGHAAGGAVLILADLAADLLHRLDRSERGRDE